MMMFPVLFSFLLLAKTGDSSTSCSIDEIFLPMRQTTVQHYFNCSVDQGKTASKITWKRHDKILKQAAGPRTWFGLTLDKFAVKYAKDLRCEVMIGKQNQTCGISLEDPPRITSRKQAYEAYVGTSLVIPCRAIGSPEPVITWIKRNKFLVAQDMPPSIKQIRSRASLDLVFKKISMMHGGIYTCHAVNRLGKDKLFVLIVVRYYPILRPPRVVPVRHVVAARTGSTAVLACSSKYTPRRYTALFWDHQGTRLTNTPRHHIQSRYSVKIIKRKYKDERVDMCLVISHVTSKDNGLYTCGVVTHVGRHENHVVLRIKD